MSLSSCECLAWSSLFCHDLQECWCWRLFLSGLSLCCSESLSAGLGGIGVALSCLLWVVLRVVLCVLLGFVGFGVDVGPFCGVFFNTKS
jgi:hypothetical protein